MDANKAILDVFTADADAPSARKEVTDPELLKQLNGASQKEVTDPKILEQLNGERQATKTDESKWEDFPLNPSKDIHQAMIGLRERGIGIDQVLNHMDVGQYVPFYSDGKIKMGLPSNKELAEEEKNLEKQEGGGVSGWVARQIGDPVSYMGGPEKAGIAAKGAIQSGVSSLLGASKNPDQTIGQRARGAAAAVPLGFASGKAFGYAGGKLAEKIGTTGNVKNVTPTTDAPGVLGWIKNTLMDKKTPTMTKDVESLGNAAKKVGLEITGKEPKQIYQELKDWYSKSISDIALSQSKGIVAGNTHPIGVNFAVSETYDKSRQGVTQLYNEASKIGEGQQVEVEGLKQNLGSLIAEMKAKAPVRGIDPKHDATLDRMEDLYDEIGKSSKPTLNEMLGHTIKEPETVSANWLSDLKQTLNQYHVAAPERTRKDLPYTRLGGKVREAIGKTSPEFQAALGKADSAHTEVERVFGNKTLGKFWKPEDHDAFKLVTGRGGNLNVDTAARASQMLDNIKSSSDLDALRESLPKEYYDSVRSAKFYQLMNKAGLDANAIDKDYDLIVKSLADDPSAVHAVDAIKTVVEQMNARNIKNIAPGAFQKTDSLIDRSMRYLIGHTPFGAKVKAINAVVGSSARKQTSPEAQTRVLNYAKDLSKSKPQPVYSAGPVAKGLAVPVQTSIGKQTQ